MANHESLKPMRSLRRRDILPERYDKADRREVSLDRMANLFTAQAGGLGQLVECRPAHAVVVACIEHRAPNRVGGPNKAEDRSGYAKMVGIEDRVRDRCPGVHAGRLAGDATRFAADGGPQRRNRPGPRGRGAHRWWRACQTGADPRPSRCALVVA
jgi:hypothetical protein